MKNTVKLNETQLRKIVAESVKKVLEESGLNGHTRNDAKQMRERWRNVKSAFDTIKDYIYQSQASNPRVSGEYLDSLVAELESIKNKISYDSEFATAAINQDVNPYVRRNGKAVPETYRTDDEEPEDELEKIEHGYFDNI